MPAIVLLGMPGSRRVPPVPLPLFLLWPFVYLCWGVAALLRRDRPDDAAKLLAAVHVFRELRGLTLDVDAADDTRVKIRFL